MPSVDWGKKPQPKAPDLDQFVQADRRDMAHGFDQPRARTFAVAEGDRRGPVGSSQRMRQHRFQPRQQ